MLAQELGPRRGPGPPAPWREGSRRGLRGSRLPHPVDRDSVRVHLRPGAPPGGDGWGARTSRLPPVRVKPPPSLGGLRIKPSLHVSTREFAVSRLCSQTLLQENPHHGPLKQVRLPVSQMGIIGALKVMWLVSRSPYARVTPKRVAPPQLASLRFASEGTGLDTQQTLAGSQL